MLFEFAVRCFRAVNLKRVLTLNPVICQSFMQFQWQTMLCGPSFHSCGVWLAMEEREMERSMKNMKCQTTNSYHAGVLRQKNVTKDQRVPLLACSAKKKNRFRRCWDPQLPLTVLLWIIWQSPNPGSPLESRHVFLKPVLSSPSVLLINKNGVVLQDEEIKTER